MTAAEIILARRRIEADSREIQRKLRDYEKPCSWAQRNALNDRLPRNEKDLRDLHIQWCAQVAVENKPIIATVETELQAMQPAIERAYRLVQNAVIFVDPAQAAQHPDFAKSQQDVADAHHILAKRDDLIFKMARAKAAIAESRAA